MSKKIFLFLFIFMSFLMISGNTWAATAQIADGAYHTLAIKTNGTLWAWGRDDYGQLGDGTTTDKLSPVQIGSDTNWAMVAAGYGHTIAIKTNDILWAWGSNSNGELGDGTTTDKLSPVQIIALGTATTTSTTTTTTTTKTSSTTSTTTTTTSSSTTTTTVLCSNKKPIISKLSKTNGKPGVVITITGKNFCDSKGQVFFGNITAVDSVWSDKSITLTVPVMTVEKKGKTVLVKVTNSNGKSSNTKPFKVLPAK